MSAHTTRSETKTGGVSVNIGAGASLPPPVDTSAVPSAPVLAWWPVVLFALSVAFATGGSYWQTRANADSIREIRTDVRSLIRFHGVAVDPAAPSR